MGSRTTVLRWLVACAAAGGGAAKCDYRVRGKCCTARNSHGAPGVGLLDAKATVAAKTETASGGYLVDLRLDLRFLETTDDLWWPVTWPHLVESHGFEIHVFVVDEDLGSFWHVHGERGRAHSDLERPCNDVMRGVAWHAADGDCDWVAADPQRRCGAEDATTGEAAYDGCRCACNTQFAEFFYAHAVPVAVGGTSPFFRRLVPARDPSDGTRAGTFAGVDVYL